MFLGHPAVALGCKRIAPETSLGTLMAAAIFLDLLWPLLLIAKIEHVAIVPGITKVTPLDFYDYPISHSFLTTCIWGLLFGAVYLFVRKNVRAALVVAFLVVSHWILDFVVHRADLPLFPIADSPKLGLGLWNSVVWTLVAELGLYAAGILIYVRTTRARDRVGSTGFWISIAFLLAIYVANLMSPPPPNAPAIAWVGLAGWLIPLLFAWIDRHRSVRLLSE
jgi:hypothetical protein